MIKEDEIDHLGWLARIELKKEEKEKFGKELNSILEYFKVIDEIDVKSVEPTYHIIGIKNVVREDKVKKSLEQKEALGNAPKKEKGYFKAPRIL